MHEAADEPAELLADDGIVLDEPEAAALKQLLDDFGDIDTALRAIEMLGQEAKAA